jgi:sugar/nucleoside kinase (ribokinase family)
MEETLTSGFLQQVDLLAINEDEAGALLGGQFEPGSPGRFLDRLRDLLWSQNDAMKVVLSAGKSGAFALDRSWEFCPSFEVEVASTAGAGDALFGGVIAGLVSGMNLPLALELGTLLAAFSVTSPHTIHPDANLGNLLAFAGENDIALTSQLASRIGKGASG